ncbi:uncharacterized protein EDB93DRAFT_1253923 [Suillus bovinus]|uniref:uncharacterized protein n=1 Tax=Suillus bovinus TaxID=48563 RepID=UPI001B860FED|nr:uncharacterized protein EDB93DRAFT_1253923 [Suillus bovinus]KAG2136478.1 hypothetical protein EDB93DRAFT_1253923 [Suillus bovinus]
MSSHSVMQLNNIMQARHGASFAAHMRYEEKRSGPENLTVWTMTCFIDDMKYGEASATSKKAAREAAAQKTIEMMEAE